jgi:hypothetical protein
LACPFFVPTERVDDLALPHPVRLPLGAAWRGHCAALGHELATLGAQELEGCNLGYAHSCFRLPVERTCDAVRFGIVKESAISISVQVVFETGHRPAGIYSLEYDLVSNTWSRLHADMRVQMQAECFLRAYLERKSRKEKAFSTEDTESTEEITEPR